MESIICNPKSNIIPDIHYSSDNRLLFSFYCSDFEGNINIKAKHIPDVNAIYSKLKKAPEDLVWRNYLILNLTADSNDPSEVSFNKIISNYFTAKEAADYFGIAVKTIRNWTSEGRIPFQKIGRSVRYNKKEIEEYFKKNKRK